MSERVRVIAYCAECDRSWIEEVERWAAHLTDDEPPNVVLFCPNCAEREFGDS